MITAQDNPYLFIGRFIKFIEGRIPFIDQQLSIYIYTNCVIPSNTDLIGPRVQIACPFRNRYEFRMLLIFRFNSTPPGIIQLVDPLSFEWLAQGRNPIGDRISARIDIIEPHGKINRLKEFFKNKPVGPVGGYRIPEWVCE